MKSDPVVARHLKDLLEKVGYLRAQQDIGLARLQKDLGARLAGFRNLLIHEYAVITTSRMHEFLRHNLRDFDRFARAVRTYGRRQRG